MLQALLPASHFQPFGPAALQELGSADFDLTAEAADPANTVTRAEGHATGSRA